MSMLQLKNIPEKTKRSLRKRAKDQGLSMSDYVLKLIERDLERQTPEEIKAMLATLPKHDWERGTAARMLEEARREREEELGW